MALADNKIGTYEFHNLDSLGPDFNNQLLVESRAGVDDVILWKVGKRGQQFTTSSLRLVANLAAAHSLVESYRTAIGDTLDYKFGGIVQTHKVSVIDVRPQPQGVRAIISGLDEDGSTFGAMVRADWTLIYREEES